MSAPPDTPEQVDELLALGATRDVELNGRGLWRHPNYPGTTWHGAAKAIAALNGRPIPYPANPMLPWMG